MDEFRFVMKCFAFAAIFLVLSQIKAGNTTIENHIQSSLVNSKVANQVNKVADGGVKLINDGYHYAVDFYQDWRNANSFASTNSNQVSASKSQKADLKVTHIQTESSLEEDAGFVEEE